MINIKDKINSVGWMMVINKARKCLAKYISYNVNQYVHNKIDASQPYYFETFRYEINRNAKY